MSIFDKLPRRFKNRIRLVFAAIFSKRSDLDVTMKSTSKAYEYLDSTPPNVVLRGWGNPYDVLPGFLHQHDSLDDETIQLTDKKNIQNRPKRMFYDFCIILHAKPNLKLLLR